MSQNKSDTNSTSTSSIRTDLHQKSIVHNQSGLESILSDDLQLNHFQEQNSTTICTSPACVQAAAVILDSIDPSVDPCNDFYGYVCNNWIQKHPIPKVRKQSLSKWRFCSLKTFFNIFLTLGPT